MLSSSSISIITIFFHQPFKLKFLLGRHLATNSFGLGRLSTNQVASFKILGAMATNLVATRRVVNYSSTIDFRSFVLTSTLFLHSDFFRVLVFSGVFFLTVTLIAVFYNAPDYVCFEMRSSLSFLFPYPFAQNTSFFHFVPCRFVLSDFFSFLFFSLFHKPLQTDIRLPVFFHGLLSKRACLLSPIFLSQPSLFSHAFPCILFSTIRGGNLIVIICQ